MIEKKKNGDSVSLIKSILILLGSLVFSFLFSLLIMEISIIMVLFVNGSSEFTLYLHMFEWTHTNITYSIPEQYRWTLGYIINLAVSTITYLIFIRKKNQNFIPLLTWAPGAFIYTSFAILSGAWSGLIHQEILTILHYTFLVIGFILTLSIRPLLYNARKTPLWKLLIINSCVWPIFSLFRALYHADYNLANLDPSLIIAFLVMALLLSLLEKPFYPLFERMMHVRTHDIKWKTTIISCSLALLFVVIFSISPYEPYSEKVYLSDLITFIISMGISIMGVIMIIARFDVLRLEFKREVVEITKKKKIKVEKLAVVEKKLDKEESIVEELFEEKYIEQESVEMIERVPEELPVEKFIFEEIQLPIEEMESVIGEKEIKILPIEEEEKPIEEVELTVDITEIKGSVGEKLSKQELSIAEEVSEIHKEPEKMKISEEIDAIETIEAETVSSESYSKEADFSQEVEMKEIKLIKELETEKEDITEKIKIIPTGNLICQYCGFKNDDDANHCVQCGQTIKQ